jgi:peptide/nickel transport system substrate-binding protein
MQVNVVPKSVGDWVTAMGKGDFDISIFDYQYNDPDILYLLFNSSQGGGKGLAFTNYNNPTIDLLTQEGRQALNPKTAKSIYYKIQKQLVSNAVAVPLAVPIGVTATRSRVKGWHTDIAGNVLLQDLYVGK